MDTLGRDLLADPAVFTPPVSIAVLLFVGGALQVGNVSGAPASTSMLAVGAIVGLGLATGSVDWTVFGDILAWWLLSPVIDFWLAAMVGRYFYPTVDRLVAIDRRPGPLVALETDGRVSRPVPGPNTTRREHVWTAVLVGIGCLMAFSSGTSNIANAVAALVGSGELRMNTAISVGSAAVADVPEAAELFDPGTTLRVLGIQNLVPIAATIGSFVTLAGGPVTLSSPARPVVTRRAR